MLVSIIIWDTKTGNCGDAVDNHCCRCQGRFKTGRLRFCFYFSLSMAFFLSFYFYFLLFKQEILGVEITASTCRVKRSGTVQSQPHGVPDLQTSE